MDNNEYKLKLAEQRTERWVLLLCLGLPIGGLLSFPFIDMALVWMQGVCQ